MERRLGTHGPGKKIILRTLGLAKIHDFAYRSGSGLVLVYTSPDRSWIDLRQKSLAKPPLPSLINNFYYNNKL